MSPGLIMHYENDISDLERGYWRAELAEINMGCARSTLVLALEEIAYGLFYLLCLPIWGQGVRLRNYLR